MSTCKLTYLVKEILHYDYRFPTPLLKSFCNILDIDRGGKNKREEMVEIIVAFLMEPKSSDKALPSSTKKGMC